MGKHFHRVPRDLAGNLAYRRDVLAFANGNRARQQALMQACREDILYFIATFCWIYEPRSSRLVGTSSNILPFIPYEFQCETFEQMLDVLGKEDIGIEKSRDLGATWMVLTLLFHQWVFEPFSSFGLLSRNEDLVDRTGKKDTLMWKLDFLLNGEGNLYGLPHWMRPESHRIRLNLINKSNGSTFEGASTTADAFRGGRKKAIMMDEYAAFESRDGYEVLGATQHATDCRIFVSTPKGAAGAYYDVMHSPSNMCKITLSWDQHPDRCIGLYRSEGGELEILDRNYEFPEGYEYILDGKLRSPYYDRECRRPGVTPQQIAQELDRDYGGSEYQLFGQDMYEAAKDSLLNPRNTINFSCDDELRPSFEIADKAPMSVWHFLHGDRPEHSNYVIGCDISSGLGGSFTSNSVASVWDAVKRCQVAEYVTSTVRPSDFAELIVSMCKWYHQAFLIWEVNGSPGSAFTQRLLDLQYHQIYYRQVEHKGFRKITTDPGWRSNDRTKPSVLQEFARAVRSGECFIRSEPLLNECRQYIYKDGKIVHSRSIKTVDESARGQAHGDRVIAAALAWHGIQDRPDKGKPASAPETYTESNPPPNTMAWRLKQHLQLQSEGRENEWL